MWYKHSLETCGGTEVFTSTTIVNKCGAKTSRRRNGCHILETDHNLVMVVACNGGGKKEMVWIGEV